MSDELWIVFPGLSMPPEDYDALAAKLPGEVRVLDSWKTTVTSTPEALKTALGALPRPVTLVGHSVGALAALEWALENPTNVERLVLLDPSTPFGKSPRHHVVGGRKFRRGVVEALTRNELVASWVGRRVRNQFLRGYGVTVEPLPPETVLQRFGNQEAVLMIWDQLGDRHAQKSRIRALLANQPKPSSRIPIDQIIGTNATQSAIRKRRGLAARLGARLTEIDAGHLFPIAPSRELITLLTATPDQPNRPTGTS